MRRVISFLSLSLALLAVLGTSAHAADAETANDCVRIRKTDESTGLGLDVDNNCRQRLACAVSWVVQCETATGKVTRSKRGEAHFLLAPAKSGRANASAVGCGEAWRVDDVAWSCTPAK